MKKIIITFFILVNFLFAESIFLASDPYPPFVSTNKSGVLKEIVEEAFKIKGYSLKIEVTSWPRAYELSIKGVYDGLIGIHYSIEREKNFIFSQPVIYNELSFFSLKSNNININELEAYKIGVVKGYNYSKEFNENLNIRKLEALNVNDNVRALINSRVNLIIESTYVLKYLLNNDFKSYKDKIVSIKSFSEKPLYIALTKKNMSSEIIIKDFNEGLEEIKKNGTYKRLLKKYNLN